MRTGKTHPCRGAAAFAAAVLLASAAAGAEGLKVGEPFDLTPGLVKADQRWPAVAFGGGVYLVVWQEGEAMAGVKDTNILAARVRPDGKPIDEEGFPVCAAKGFQAYPAVAFDGTDFLVAWQDYRGGQDWDLYAARVSPGGKVLDTDGFAVAKCPGNQIYPAVASDGKSALVVWSDVRPGFKPEVYGLYGTFVRAGRPGEVNGRRLAKTACSLLLPAAVFDGEAFLVAAVHATPGWSPGRPFLLRVDAKTRAEPVQGGFLTWTYCLAADPAGKRTLVWSNCRTEHGSYQPKYLLSVYPAGRTHEQAHQIPLGLQDRFPPRNDLWCAATFDGKNFVAVVEQVPNLRGEPGGHPRVNVDLVATRVDPKTAEPLDTGAEKVPPKALRDIRPYGKSPQAKAKARPAVNVAAEPVVQERHPAMASAGGGRSLLVYSRRGGVAKFKIHGVLLSE